MKHAQYMVAIPLICGIGLALAFPTFHWYPLAWVLLAPLMVLARSATPRKAAGIFLLAGWAFHTILLQWLTSNIYWAGGFAILGMQGLCLALSLYWAVVGLAWNYLARRASGWSTALAVAALWTGMEWLQSWNFSGFGWGALGYSQGADLPLAQWAALGGVPLISFWLILVNALVAEAWCLRDGRWVRVALAVLTVAATHLIGWGLLGEPVPRAQALRVGLVQPNYAQQMKYDPDFLEDMVWRVAEHGRVLARSEPVDLFVWPEALIMTDYQDRRIAEQLQQFVKETGADLFSGTVRHEPGTRASYNSSMLLLKDGAFTDYYDKVHLAPFGEYLPFDDVIPFLRAIVPADVDQGVGQKVIPYEKGNIGPLICFEVLFPPMAATLREEGADLLAVVTNLGWFGKSNSAAQEWEIARFRAIETRLPVVHSANSGVSGVIDPWGRYQIVDKVVVQGRQLAQIDPAWVTPHGVVQTRRLGAFEVPQAADHPWPAGPTTVPWLVGLAGVLLIGFGAIRGRLPARP